MPLNQTACPVAAIKYVIFADLVKKLVDVCPNITIGKIYNLSHLLADKVDATS